MLAMGFFLYMSFTKLRMFPSLLISLRFYHERVLNFINAFFASTEMIMGICPLFYVFFICDVNRFPSGIISLLSEELPSAFFLEVICWVHILLDFIYLSMSSFPSFSMDLFTGYRVLGWQFFFFHWFWWEICIRISFSLWVMHCFSPASSKFFLG